MKMETETLEALEKCISHLILELGVVVFFTAGALMWLRSWLKGD